MTTLKREEATDCFLPENSGELKEALQALELTPEQTKVWLGFRSNERDLVDGWFAEVHSATGGPIFLDGFVYLDDLVTVLLEAGYTYEALGFS